MDMLDIVDWERLEEAFIEFCITHGRWIEPSEFGALLGLQPEWVERRAREEGWVDQGKARDRVRDALLRSVRALCDEQLEPGRGDRPRLPGNLVILAARKFLDDMKILDQSSPGPR